MWVITAEVFNQPSYSSGVSLLIGSCSNVGYLASVQPYPIDVESKL